MIEISKNSKSNLARLMATENLLVEHHHIPTAYFDVANRILGLPIWKDMGDDLYDCLVGHEIGHALETPEKGLSEGMDRIDPNSNNHAIVKGYLNVVEDARIEKLVKRRYPGMRRSFLLGYQEMIKRDFFKLTGLNVNDLAFIDRINLHFKSGPLMVISFTNEEKLFIDDIENCETFEDVVLVTKRLYEYCKAAKSQTDRNQHPNNPNNLEKSKDETPTKSEKSESGESGEKDDPKSSEKNNNSKDASDNSETSNGNADNNSDEESKNKSPVGAPVGGNSFGAGSDGNFVDGSAPPVKSMTDEALNKIRESFTEKSPKENLYLNIPENINLDNIIVDYKNVHNDILNHYKGSLFYKEANSDYLNFKTNSDKNVNHMVKEFEMRKAADEYARTAVARTGVLDTVKLHSYKYNEDLFKRVTTVLDGKNHGIVMFIDMSGSMHSHMPGTIDQLMIFVTFCRRVHIPYEVYGFTNNEENKTSKTMNKANYKSGDLVLNHRFTLRNYFSSKMSATEYNAACINMTCLKKSFMGAYHEGSYNQNYMATPKSECLGGTPLNDAIIAARKIVPKFKSDNKIQVVNTIFLTDGNSDPIQLYYDEVNGKTYISSWLKTIHIRDLKTKKSYRCETAYTQVTESLLLSLREITNSNVIGFYICGSRHLRNKITFENREEKMNFFKKNNFVELSDAGYSPYYLINDDSLDYDDDDFLDVTKDIKEYKKSTLAKKFMKYNKNKNVNRVLVSRFIEKIAKELS